MTRETRIGLLVGLLFIIMFGMVLGGFVNRGNTPPTGVTPVANTVVASGDTATDGRAIRYRPTIESERTAPLPPDNTTLAARTGAAVPPGVVVSTLSPAGDGGAVVNTTTLPPVGAPPVGDGSSIASHSTGGGRITEITVDDASRIRDLVTPGPVAVIPPVHPVVPVVPVADPSTAALPAGAKTYEVKAGDTLYAIARSQYGPGHTAEHARILEANKDKITSVSNLKLGMKLIIPALPATPTAAAPRTETVRPVAPVTPRSSSTTTQPVPTRAAPRLIEVVRGPESTGPLPPLTAPTPAARKAYVINKGDTLFKIARENKTTIPELVKLNGLKNTNLKPGAKLDLPG